MIRIVRAFGLGALIISAPAMAQNVPLKDLPRHTREIEEPFSLIAGAIEIKPGQVMAVDMTEMELAIVDFAKGTKTPIGRQGSGPGE